MVSPFSLNEGAAEKARPLLENPEAFGVEVHEVAGATILDCGIAARGGLEAGRSLAEACLGGQGRVSLGMSRVGGIPRPTVTVATDQPLHACLLSQYAGWKVANETFFAMTSGPIRLFAKAEPLVRELGYSEDESPIAVGVMETSRIPTPEVISQIRESVDAPKLLLLVAPTASIAGSLQVVARSVETCLHKLHHLGIDPARVRSAIGTAPLPPIPKDDLNAIGRTNDAILYGGEVVLWLDVDPSEIERLGPQIPASASKDHGEPFAEIFRRYSGDFYAIDPLLFSPAVVVFENRADGACRSFGRLEPAVLEKSFRG